MVWSAKANGVRWYGYVLRTEGEDVLQRVLNFEEDDPNASGESKLKRE